MAEHPLITKALTGLTYPATHAQIVAEAESSSTDSTTMDVLHALPEKIYENLEAVLEEARHI